jgi:MarR-like DNA-binding transcriptional regulator SgrR of sgrS sRNA
MIQVYLLFLHRLEDLNDAFLIVVNIDALKDFTVFSSTNFPDNFIVILLTDQKEIVLVRNQPAELQQICIADLL